MLDPNLLRHSIEIVSEKLARRNFKLDMKNLREQEKIRKLLQLETEHLQAERTLRSKEIAVAKSQQKDIKPLCQDIKLICERLNIIKSKLKKIRIINRNYIMSIPNIPAEEVPTGPNNKYNKEIFRWGKPRTYDFPIKDHVFLGKKLDNINFSDAVKITGNRFVVMKDKIARLHRAISQFMLNLHTEQHGYIEYYLPYLVNQESLYGTGQLPKFAEDLFHITSYNKNKSIVNNYALIPTAEVPLTNLIRNKILNQDSLPIKMTAHTPCFRAEAGSYGKETRGLIRMHQFDKIELVQIVEPEYSMQTLEELTGHAEKVLFLLGLPYRKVLLCTGDLGFAACKTYDLEVWLPTQNTYREISSCSNIRDFQARRILARYRSSNKKKIRMVHTINGSGLAVGRTLVAILENYQLADGRIIIPPVLIPYMNGLTHIET